MNLFLSWILRNRNNICSLAICCSISYWRSKFESRKSDLNTELLWSMFFNFLWLKFYDSSKQASQTDTFWSLNPMTYDFFSQHLLQTSFRHLLHRMRFRDVKILLKKLDFSSLALKSNKHKEHLQTCPSSCTSSVFANLPAFFRFSSCSCLILLINWLSSLLSFRYAFWPLHLTPLLSFYDFSKLSNSLPNKKLSEISEILIS